MLKLKMLHKCCFPGCVGELNKSWVCSQLGLETLLGFIYNGSDSHAEHALQSNKPPCEISTKLFFDPKSDSGLILRNGANLDRDEISFDDSKKVANAIHSWTNQNFQEFQINDSLYPETSYVLANSCIFKESWNADNKNGAIMKVHNSFTYTQDINYEARIIELPLKTNDATTLIIVPHHTDLLNTLYRRLTNEGLSATFASIHPVFTVTAMLKAPDVSVTSQTDVSANISDTRPNKLLQYGSINIDENGPSVKVLTCLFSTKAASPKKVLKQSFQDTKRPFFLAILFKDSPIFTVQYYSNNL